MTRTQLIITAAVAIVSAALTALGALGYSIRDLLPPPVNSGNGPRWEVLTGFAVFTGSVTYFIYKILAENERLRSVIVAATPRLVLDDRAYSDVFDGISKPIPFGDADLGYEVTSLRFRNEPDVTNEASIALAVGAEIAIFSPESGKLLFGPRIGRWVDEARTKGPLDHGPLDGALTVMNIGHGPIPAKLPLLIDVRVPSQGVGWFLFEGAEYIARMHLMFLVGEYNVRVRLSGTNLRKGTADFWFRLRPNASEQPTLTRIAAPRG
jgi:hypothetical protein